METREIRAQPHELSVCIGLPTGSQMPWQTALALAATTRLCATKGIPVEVAVVAGASIVTEARNKVLDAYFKTDCSRLFWIDSDIVWREEDFLRMLVLSEEMPVLCASYPHKRLDERHTIRLLDGEPIVNEFGCRQVAGTGLGFTVVRREVLDKLVFRRVFDEVQGEDIPDVFRVDTVLRSGRCTRRGEDIAFFSDLRDLGCEIWHDPSVKLGHVGMHVFGGGE